MAVKIEKAYPNDFEEVYSFLKYMNHKINKETWRLLFTTHWGEESYVGLKLVDEGKIVGFAGMIFSNRIVNGKNVKIATRTSTILKPEYRGKGHGKAMLYELEKFADHTIITLSGIGTTVGILKTMGHIDYETHDRFIFPIPFVSKARLITDISSILEFASDEERIIIEDHRKYKCVICAIKTSQGHSIVLFNKVHKRGLPLGRIHYISDKRIFNDSICACAFKLCSKYRIVSLFFNDRFALTKMWGTIRVKLTNPRVFKSNVLSADEIDGLYSEAILLNL